MLNFRNNKLKDFKKTIQIADNILDLMKFRGPDSKNKKVFDNAILGSNMLSIVDHSENGKMPISDETGRFHLVFNGEIYNYKELNKLIPNKTLKSQTDTEVLLNLLIEFKEDILPKLNGMFSFIFYDSKKKRNFNSKRQIRYKTCFLLPN